MSSTNTACPFTRGGTSGESTELPRNLCSDKIFRSFTMVILVISCCLGDEAKKNEMHLQRLEKEKGLRNSAHFWANSCPVEKMNPTVRIRLR